MKNNILIYDENGEVVDTVDNNKVYWYNISNRQNLSETITDKHFEDLDKYNI